MVAVILSVIFLLFAALFCFLGFRRGKKYFWGYSAVRIVGIVASVILATLLSVLIARGLSGLVYNTLLPSVNPKTFTSCSTPCPLPLRSSVRSSPW